MRRESAIDKQAWELVEQIHRLNHDDAGLRSIAEKLRIFASSPIWRTASYREASSGEELVHALALSPVNGPSLYLVSDGMGAISPPHCHETWAVIVGIRGCELNRKFSVHSDKKRTVSPLTELKVGPGEVLVLGEEEIHSTEVSGRSSTYHLHLYGRPLHELPKFQSRCYTVSELGSNL
jgi:predicted metal-dependent enzyme (double-stranded beta helix superfamily)